MDSMTVVHVLEPGGGGAMRHVLDLAAAQARAGWRVHIVYSPIRMEALFEPQLLALSRDWPNITLHSLPMHRAPHVSDAKNLFDLVKLLRVARPDILHAHSTKAGMLARMASAVVKVPVIYTPHALMTLNPKTPPWKKMIYGWYEQLLSPVMQRMIFLSQEEQAHAVSLGMPANKMVMGLNGITPFTLGDRKALRTTLKIAGDEVVVGFVGRLAPQKNPQLAIRAFAQAATKNEKLKLLLIGGGDLRGECEQLAQNLGVMDRILWLGAANAREWYGAMDLLLITSRYEVMAYIFVEALHAGLPIIATPAGGSDSCVITGQTGFTVAPDETEIAEKILQLAEDAPLRDAMHFAARAHSQNFTIPNMFELHAKIYRDALGAPKA